jgi:hypothetical protein
MKKISTVFAVLLLFLSFSTLSLWSEEPVSTTGVLLNIADPSSVKADHGANVSAWKQGDESGLKVEFSAGSKFPGISLNSPEGGWDLSAFLGVEAEVTNLGTSAVQIDLRIDNSGDWKEKKWNANHVTIPANTTKTVRVVFGKSYGQPGYALDPKAVIRAMIYVNNPTEDGVLVVKSLKAAN